MTTQLQSIELLLKQRIGMDVNSIGISALNVAVRRRMDAQSITAVSAYVDLVRRSIDEFENLVEQMVIPETWFFRERETFDFLRRFVSAPRPGRPVKNLRILSLPCASGEEPYSIAMTLLDAGLQPIDFRIEAADVSKNALQRAAEAVYGSNSFRGPDLLFRDRYFDSYGNAYRLQKRVRETVNFRQANILNYSGKGELYDILFCRNLLIYFDAAGRKKAVQTLDSLLKSDGLLFVGHAEGGSVLAPFFVSTPPLNAFVHRKSEVLPYEKSTGRSKHF